jgi:hypothetical protein
MSRAELALLSLLVAPFVACGGGSSATPDGGGAGTGGGSVDPNAIVGGFTVKLLEQDPPASQLSGVVSNGPTPEMTIWQQQMKDGACTLLKPKQPFCSTPCGSDAVCVADDTCRPHTTALDVGTVTMDGLEVAGGGSTVTFINAQNSYGAAATLSFPPFDEGGDVSVTATGTAAFPAFTIHAKGIAPLVVPAGDVPIEKNKPLALTWTAKGAASDSTITITLDLSHHGGTKAKLVCETADTGSLTIPAALMTALINYGVSGYPSLVVTRNAVGTAGTAQGKVRLTLTSPTERYMTLPDLVSCTGDTDCPTGKTCQTDLQCK